MLALLLVNANQPVSADLLIDGLWEERPPANAAKTVQIYISRLRGRLGRERILTTPAGYLLRVEAEELDASRFERLAAEGRSLLEAGNPARAEIVLSEALDLWRGEALADFRFNGFAQAEIGRLQERRASGVADRIDARLALGRAEEVIPELEALIREQPVSERPRRQLMLALYQAGRQADALEAYQAARSALVEELGIEPGRRLRELHQQILSQDPALDLAAPPDERHSQEALRTLDPNLVESPVTRDARKTDHCRLCRDHSFLRARRASRSGDAPSCGRSGAERRSGRCGTARRLGRDHRGRRAHLRLRPADGARGRRPARGEGCGRTARGTRWSGRGARGRAVDPARLPHRDQHRRSGHGRRLLDPWARHRGAAASLLAAR